MSSEPRPQTVAPPTAARRRPTRTLSRLAGVALVVGALVTGGGAAALAAPGGSPADAASGPRVTPGPCAYTYAPMLLAININNTETKVGLFRGESLESHWRLTTTPSRTPDEWAVLMYKHMDHHLRQFGA